MREVAQAERDKSSRYFLKITDFENERNQWQKLYSDQSIGHGNAQNLMMHTIEQLAAQLAAKGVKFKVPKVLQAIRDEFAETHEMPARAQLQALTESMKQAQLVSTPAEG